MRPYLIALSIVAACMATSCKNDEEINNPEWVEGWIAEIENDEYCAMCEIVRYEYSGDFYYELYSPIFSCMPCQVHYSNGDDVDWSEFSQEDYLNRRKSRVVIYKKNDI